MWLLALFSLRGNYEDTAVGTSYEAGTKYWYDKKRTGHTTRQPDHTDHIGASSVWLYECTLFSYEVGRPFGSPGSHLRDIF